MIQIWSQEGEVVVQLSDVDVNTTQSQLCDEYLAKLGEDQMDILLDIPSEGCIVEADEDVCQFEIQVKTLNQYIEEFKCWVEQ